ncbi:MAG: hypothetical protein JO225_13510, partial [Candidatus Eremiobacteraeota bacterium]|nr:hypothetical protein [Candidatus Eremiobacteraeota bacterium]
MKSIVTLILAMLVASAPAGAQGQQRFTIDARDVELSDVIRLIGAQSGQNVVADGSIHQQKVTLLLRDVTFDEAMTTLINAYGLQTHRDGRIVIVGDAASMNLRFPDTGPQGTQTHVFALARAKPDEVAESIKKALPQGTVVVADKRTASVIVTGASATIARAAQLVLALDAPIIANAGTPATTAIELHNIRASEAFKAIHTAVPDNALIADDGRNVIIVNGNAEVVATVRALLRDLDLPGRQVMFEVRVVDVQPLNDNYNVGIELGGVGYGAGGLAQFPYTVTRSAIVINAQLNTLIQNGHASLLAQPRLATLNNHQAELLVGEQYPVVTVNQQTGYPSMQLIDVGVRLKLTPTIGADGSITAELHPEYSQIIGLNNNFPILANRKLDATLRVRDGETIVLGGLFED